MGIPSVPRDMPVHHQQFLTAVKKAIESMQPSNIPPGKPANLTVNPLPGGNQILFTGGDGADSHLIQISNTPNFNPGVAGSQMVSVGQGQSHYTDTTGIAGQKRYYWVIAVRGTMKSDPPTGPVSGTTLGLNTPATPPIYVPPSRNIAKSLATGKPTILSPRKGGQRDTF